MNVLVAAWFLVASTCAFQGGARSTAFHTLELASSRTSQFQNPKIALRRTRNTSSLNQRQDSIQLNVISPEYSSALLCEVVDAAASSASSTSVSGLLQNSDVWVFVAGVFPFAWATVEFWRRIAFGEPFGTGSDSVIIGQDDAPEDSRGRRVLGRGALIVAYVLFTISFATLGIVLYSVLSSTPPTSFPSTAVPPELLP